MKKILFIFLFLYACFPASSYAINSDVETVYNRFIAKIDSKYTPIEQSTILSSLRDKLSILSYQQNSLRKQEAIEDFFSLNNEKIYNNWLKNQYLQSSQKTIESNEHLVLQVAATKIIHPSYVLELLKNKNINFIYTNSKRELLQDNTIYKFVYSQYFPVTSENIKNLSQKTGTLIFSEDGDYRLVSSYTLEKKLAYSELSKNFLAFITPENKIVQRNNIFYGFLFQKTQYYQDTYGLYESELSNSNITPSKTLLYLDADGRYNFITDFTQRELISTNDAFGIPEKHLFLKYLVEDSRYLESNISSNMKKIQTFTHELTDGKTKQEKIELIYNWILENLEYSEILDINDMKIFSGGEAFQRQDGVCTAYSRLMAYMMLYAGLYDVEVIEGYVIDAVDFPKIGHAWIRYENGYYDPTFDDPVGSTNTKTKSEYKYFNIPQDIFYANRFLYDTIPESFLTASRSDIELYIYNYLKNLISKYQSQIKDYEIFSPIVFRTQYNINTNATINPELLSQKIGSYVVNGKTLSFTQDGKEKFIKKLNYYVLDSSNTEFILSQIGYNLEGVYLFNWNNSNGTSEWRLAYDVEFQ